MKKMFRKLLMAMATLVCMVGLIMSDAALAGACVDNGNGTVTDNNTGLMWQKDSAGPINWHKAMSYAASLSLGGHSDWRLPERNELSMLYHSVCKEKMIVQPGAYWSASDDDMVAGVVDFVHGRVGHGNKELGNCYVRAVRTAQ